MMATLPPDDYLTDLAQRYYDSCIEKDSQLNETETLKMLGEAIRISPTHCIVLAECFQLRAKIQMNAAAYDVRLYIYICIGE